jgi:hypothetical protein
MEFAMMNLRKTILLFTVFFAIFGLVPISWTAVIFETNFDNLADWNTSGQYEGGECSVRGYSDPANMCPATNYPGYDPQNYPIGFFNAYRSMPYLSTSNPVASIRRLPGPLADHSGTGTGKAFIVYNHSNKTNPGYWAGDGIIGNYFPGSSYLEWYVQYWIRTQANWAWGPRDSQVINQVKMFRVFNYHSGSSGPNIFQGFSSGYLGPITLFDGIDIGYAMAYRCDPIASDYYCANAPAYEQNDTQTSWGQNLFDASWHRITMRYKMNTIGSRNGIFELYYDGNQILNKTDVVWVENGSTHTGWNGFMIGGNSDNAFNGTDQWYVVDDFVVSTTAIPSDYIPGGGQIDTTPPSAPRGLTVR